jgi:aminopeptidase YwaD
VDDGALHSNIGTYLRELCATYPDRHLGGPGNRAATDLFERVALASGFQVESAELPCVDWARGSAGIEGSGEAFALHPGPYSLACDVTAPLASASTVEELEGGDFAGAVLLLRGDLVREQLMAKGFVFYNPESHRRIVAALEAQAPSAIIAATDRNPELSGGAYPFPLIEDADFDIPNAYTTDVEGEALLGLVGQAVSVRIDSTRVPALAAQPIARKRGSGTGRVVLTAHIDSKDGSPGALDNATGAATLLGCMELLAGYQGPHTVEVVPFNGEDYHAATGQMYYVADNEGRWGDIVLDLNVDGAGSAGSGTEVSFYGVPGGRRQLVERSMRDRGFAEGPQWPQGDHSIFAMQGVPAVAVTSANVFFISSTVAHTERDTLEGVDVGTVVSVAGFLADTVTGLANEGRGER